MTTIKKCKKCGSPMLFQKHEHPEHLSLYKCIDCGYEEVTLGEEDKKNDRLEAKAKINS